MPNQIPAMHWRWDQGRLDYFRFDMIKCIAGVLCSLENVSLKLTPDPLRSALISNTGLPFAPDHYRVWRNYARVFGCCLLATEVGDKLICSELCHRIAAPSPDDMDPEIYFGNFIRKFYYPSPVFLGYTASSKQHFPVCAVLKLLLARLRSGQPAVVTVDDIVRLILANFCTGREKIEHYVGLKPKAFTPAEGETRQIRELIRFISQISILKWSQPYLFLDIDPSNSEALQYVERLSQPFINERKTDPALELLELGSFRDSGVLPIIPSPGGDEDLFFSEGKPKRVTHLRYERSSRLRDLFFASRQPPFFCDMCALNVSRQYPWTSNLLEVHHLLPLSSPLKIEKLRTSLSELVGVCPSCHKATHHFYRKWLNDNEQDDFTSYNEAISVFDLAKRSVIRN